MSKTELPGKTKEQMAFMSKEIYESFNELAKLKLILDKYYN